MKEVFKVIGKILRILMYLILILFILLFYRLCRGEIVKESYYIISMDPQYERKEVPNAIEEIYFDYSKNIVIKLKNLNNNLYLKNIEVYYHEKEIGEININKYLNDTYYIKDSVFEYSIDRDLTLLFGKENEKYKIISSGPYMDGNFLFEIIIEDKNNKTYTIKRRMSIAFEEKGKRKKTVIDH